MKWLKNLFKKKEKEESPGVEIEECVEPEIKQLTEPSLQDKNGEDYICPLCDNQDNETGKYFPITKENKRSFNGKKWHKGCLRVFKKQAKVGKLG